MGARRLVAVGAAVLALATPSAAGAAVAPAHHRDVAEPRLVASGLEGGSGSTIGPDGALYVTEGQAGRVSRVDLRTGEVTTFASGLPERIAPVGGPIDVAFRGSTAYVLVTLVGPEVGGADDVVGIYRVDGPSSVTVVADLGAFSHANPPATDFFVPTGVQYALEPYRDGFLVTDGHHNRVLQVSLDGEVTEVLTLGNVVPTGIEATGGTVHVTLAGPVPHRPEDGRLVAFRVGDPAAQEVASGARLPVDVERGRGGVLYVLAQGDFREGDPEGTPAQPGTGSLVRVDRDGTLDVVVDGLDRPTSLELVGGTAYVVTLGGVVWRIDGLGTPGRAHGHGPGHATGLLRRGG